MNPILNRMVPVREGIRNASVAVAGTGIVQAGEVGNNCLPAFGTNRIDRLGQIAFLPGEDIHDFGGVEAFLPHIKNHFAAAARQPLQHTALLPVPGGGFIKLHPLVIIFQVNVSQVDYVIRFG